MNIKIDPHTLERAAERGTNEDEIRDVLMTGFDIPAKKHRKGKAKIYRFDQIRLNTLYEQKRVEVIYAIESARIVTTTVYVFYGRWEEHK